MSKFIESIHCERCKKYSIEYCKENNFKFSGVKLLAYNIAGVNKDLCKQCKKQYEKDGFVLKAYYPF
jgi:HD superfamily phosphohydrolase YqeK